MKPNSSSQRSEENQQGFFDSRIEYGNGIGNSISPMECVVPIGFFDPENEFFHPFATAIFIAIEGLICTARHVFRFEPKFLEQMPHLSPASYPAVFQYFPDHTTMPRPIVAVHEHPNFDLSVALCMPLTNNSTGERFDNKMHAMSAEYFPIGTNVHHYSFPDPIIYEKEKSLQTVMIPLCTTGKIIDWLPNGMGNLFPSPVYVIEGYIGAGSSGGPVMDEYGRAFAIASRGCAELDYYYAVPVREIADIEVASIGLGSPPQIMGPTIREMVGRKLISFVKMVENKK
jgi:hypothetical protein